jgi:hypothetical protein
MGKDGDWKATKQEPREMWAWIMRTIREMKIYDLMTCYAHKPGEKHALFHLTKKPDGEYVFWVETLRVNILYCMPSMVVECCQYCSDNGMELYLSIIQPRTEQLDIPGFYLESYKEAQDG